MTGTNFSKLTHLGSADLQRLAVFQRELYSENLPPEVRKWMETETEEMKKAKKRGENYDN